VHNKMKMVSTGIACLFISDAGGSHQYTYS